MNSAPKTPSTPTHFLLLIWLVLTSLVIFGVAVAVDQGLLQQMLVADRSQICIVVIGMYLLGLGHTFIRTRYISTQVALAESAVTTLMDAEHVKVSKHQLTFGEHPVTSGFLHDYLVEELNTQHELTGGTTNLLDAYAAKIRSANEFGWFFIDLMLKVGFLGTLVGFILMLSSVADTGSLDATTMQKVLKQMSLGMSTALYTTLASLVGGILLSLPYYLLDRGLDHLLQLTVQAKEVLLPTRRVIRTTD